MGKLKLFKEHYISKGSSAREALKILDQLPDNDSRTLFVLDGSKLVGTLTDGDIRRGLLKDKEISHNVEVFMNSSFNSLKKEQVKPDILSAYREKEIWLIPVVNGEGSILEIIDLKGLRTVIPAAALLMAGGRGERLKPLTDTQPKPMLRVVDKPILEINIERLTKFGIKKFYISVRYLSERIMEYFGDGNKWNISIEYIHEEAPLGTLGACAKIRNLQYDHLLVMNSDILTNVDFEDFYNFHRTKDAIMTAASIPYKVQVPYGIMQTDETDYIIGLVEKPTYTHYANAGIYFIEKELISEIPFNTMYNATDLMQTLVDRKDKLVHYPILQYWLDIGKYEDYIKAQEDFKHIKF